MCHNTAITRLSQSDRVGEGGTSVSQQNKIRRLSEHPVRRGHRCFSEYIALCQLVFVLPSVLQDEGRSNNSLNDF